MTREEAKAILENDIVDGHVEGNARFMDAFWMAVDALSQELCEDCISRKAVEEAIENDARLGGLLSVFASYDDAQKFKATIKNLPSVQPISVIKDIKAEIEHVADYTYGSTNYDADLYNGAYKDGLYEAIDIIDKHIQNECMFSDYPEQPYQFDNMTGSMNL